MRFILPLTIVATVFAGSSAFAQTVDADGFAAARPSVEFSADATRSWYRLNGDRHSTVREENGTSSWEGAGPFGGNPNGN